MRTRHEQALLVQYREFLLTASQIILGNAVRREGLDEGSPESSDAGLDAGVGENLDGVPR
jgi:hypothetical protein